MHVSASDLSFSATQGQGNPASKAMTISNSGDALLRWEAEVNPPAAWLSLSEMRGMVAAHAVQQVMLHVDAGGLSPNTYNAQINIHAINSVVQGSPQVLTVQLTVFQPCTLQVMPTSLTFSAALLQTNPPAQSLMFKETGHCSGPVTLAIAVGPGASWLSVSNASVQDNGSGAAVLVEVNTGGLRVGHFSGQITISATDSSGTVLKGSPQTVTVTLDAVTV